MTTLLLIRHGETDAVDKILAGRAPGWSLNQAGRLQVKQLTQVLADLPIKAIYSSPLERTLETAQMIASKHGITPIVRAQLGEMDFGGWEGKAFPQLANNSEWNQFNCTRSLVRPPAGEMMVEVQVRMVLEAGDIKSRHEGDTVAIVSHADPIRALIAHYLGSPLDMLSRFAISVASVSVVRFEGQVPTVAAINYQGELER